MRHLLRAMTFWVWGLLAIGIAVSVIPVSYRVAHLSQTLASFKPLGPNPFSATELTRAPLSTAGSPSPMVSHLIAAEIRDAHAALQAGDWNGALRFLAAAEGKSPLTVFDRKTIADFKGYAYLKLARFRDAQYAYQEGVATGAYTPEDAEKTRRMLFRIAATTKDYATAIEYGEQLAAADEATQADLGLLTQIAYVQHNCGQAADWADKTIAAARAAGETPPENVYLFKLQCASDASDSSAMRATLADLVLLTHKTTYWNALLRLERQDERDDHNLLMIYRLMYDTHSMTVDSDYVEMAQLLADASFPGEALAVLEQGRASGVIKTSDGGRTDRLMGSLSQRAAVGKQTLAVLTTGAEEKSTADQDAAAGALYFGFGRYDEAVAAIESAILKGRLRHLDDAYVYLGRSQHALGDDAQAATAFEHLKSVPNISDRIARLWALYAEALEPN